MATSIRFEWNRPQLRWAALAGPGARAAVTAATEAAAARARSNNEIGHSDLTTVSTFIGGRSRARGYVRLEGPAAQAREAKYRILGRSI